MAADYGKTKDAFQKRPQTTRTVTVADDPKRAQDSKDSKTLAKKFEQASRDRILSKRVSIEDGEDKPESATTDSAKREFTPRAAKLRRANSHFTDSNSFWKSQEEKTKPSGQRSLDALKTAREQYFNKTATSTTPTPASDNKPAPSSTKPLSSSATIDKGTTAAKPKDKEATAPVQPAEDQPIKRAVSSSTVPAHGHHQLPAPTTPSKPASPDTKRTDSPVKPASPSTTPATPPVSPPNTGSTDAVTETKPRRDSKSKSTGGMPSSKDDEERKKIEERKRKIEEFKKKKEEERLKQEQQKAALAAAMAAHSGEPPAEPSAEEEAKLKAEEAKRKTEEEARKKKEAEEAKRKATEDETKRKTEEEARKKKEAEEAKKKAAEEAKKKEPLSEEAKKRAAMEEEAKKKQREADEARRRIQLEEARKKAQAAAANAAAQAKAAEEPEEEDGDPTERALAGIQANTLTVLDLKMEGLEDDTIANLLKHLMTNTSVSVLLLDGNPDMKVKSFIQLNELLIHTKTLHTLSLNFVVLGEFGARAIQKGLATNTSLLNLSISGNDLFENGMNYLAAGLKPNTHIKVLNLSENSISDAGCKYLAELMAVNKTITHLDISNNYINSEGAGYVGAMLAQNQTLLHLNMERNSLEDAGCIAFAKELAHNSSLQELFLANNMILDIASLSDLCRAVKAHKALKLLDLRSNLFDIEGELALQDLILDTNRRIEVRWKKKPGKNDPPPSRADMDTIIRHFTASKLLKLFGAGQTLDPLIDIEAVLTHFLYPKSEAIQLWDLSLPPSIATFRTFHPPLDLLARVLKKQLDDMKTTPMTPSSTYFLSVLCAERITKIAEVLKYSPNDTKLRFPKLQVFRLVRLMCQHDHASVVQSVTSAGIFGLVTDTFYKCPTANLLHDEVSALLTQLLADTRTALLRDFLIKHRFLSELVTTFKRECGKPVSTRACHFGHLIKIANLINQSSVTNATVKKLAQELPGWDAFVKGPLLEVNNVHDIIPEPLRKPKNTGPAVKVVRADMEVEEPEKKEDEDE